MPETIFALTELAEAPSFEDWFVLTDKSDTAQSANGSTRKNKGQYALGSQVNAQTGTTYTYLTTDFRKLVTHSNAGAIAGTLPQAGASFPAGWWMLVQNRGAGALTITPTTSTVDGAATLVLEQNEGALVASDGTNYFTFRGKVASVGTGSIADDSVTNAKLANMATQTIKGRTTAGTGDPEDLTAAQATAILNAVVGDAGAGGTKGLVPAPAAGDTAAGKFLKADGTFAVPSGTGAETGANSDITSMDGVTGAIQSPSMIDFSEGAAPATPAANKVRLYAKADGLLYSKDDAGAETALGGGGSIAPLTIIDANTVHQKNGANAQTFAVFKTTTNNVRFEITNASSTWELASKSDAGVDAINLSIGTSKYQFGTGALLPPSNQGQNLGSSSVIWSLIYGASFDCKADGLYRWTNATKLSSAADGVMEIRRDSNAGGTVKCSPLSPAQITADQNNYNMGGCSLNVRLSTDASRSLTGLVSTPSQLTGQIHYITNVGSNNIVLVHESASSTAANRFLNNTAADITLGANEVAYVWYDGTTQRWRAAKL